MAGAFMSLALDADRPGLDPSASLVLLALCDCAPPKDPIAYPSKASIAARTGISERQVFDHLRTLVAAGFITPIAYERGGKGRAVHYRIEVGRMLERVRDASKQAAHRRVLAKIPGALPHGFEVGQASGRNANASGAPNPAEETANHAVQRGEPCGAASQTMRPTADEQGLTGINREVLEPDARTPAHEAQGSAVPQPPTPSTPLKKTEGEPDKARDGSGRMTPEAEAERSRLLLEQVKRLSATMNVSPGSR